jgi:hypothetical protein
MDNKYFSTNCCLASTHHNHHLSESGLTNMSNHTWVEAVAELEDSVRHHDLYLSLTIMENYFSFSYFSFSCTSTVSKAMKLPLDNAYLVILKPMNNSASHVPHLQ